MKSAEKLSVSVPKALARAVRRRVGARGLSKFVAQAMERELEREQAGAFLAEMDRELGIVPEELVREARAAWPAR